MPRDAALPHWPESLTVEMAAAYCGLSADRFRALCPVAPRRVGTGQRDKRWLRGELEMWLRSLPVDGASPSGKAFPLSGVDWMKRLGKHYVDDDSDNARQKI